MLVIGSEWHTSASSVGGYHTNHSPAARSSWHVFGFGGGRGPCMLQFGGHCLAFEGRGCADAPSGLPHMAFPYSHGFDDQASVVK
jgi:hypothetical protein